MSEEVSSDWLISKPIMVVLGPEFGLTFSTRNHHNYAGLFDSRDRSRDAFAVKLIAVRTSSSRINHRAWTSAHDGWDTGLGWTSQLTLVPDFKVRTCQNLLEADRSSACNSIFGRTPTMWSRSGTCPSRR